MNPNNFRKGASNALFGDIAALIFDYGGTLDSAGRHWARILRDGYAEVGIVVDNDAWHDAYIFAEKTLAADYIVKPEDNFRDMLLKKVDVEFQRFEQAGRVNLSPPNRADAVRGIADYCYNYARLYTNQSRDVLKKLHERYPMVLVSNFYGNLHTVLDDFGLNFFDSVVESAVVGVRKPDPAIFTLGVKALGCEPARTLVIGDSYDKDIVPADYAGCPTVWLRGEGWGKAPENIDIPRAIITGVRQLLPLLL